MKIWKYPNIYVISSYVVKIFAKKSGNMIRHTFLKKALEYGITKIKKYLQNIQKPDILLRKVKVFK